MLLSLESWFQMLKPDLFTIVSNPTITTVTPSSEEVDVDHLETESASLIAAVVPVVAERSRKAEEALEIGVPKRTRPSKEKVKLRKVKRRPSNNAPKVKGKNQSRTKLLLLRLPPQNLKRRL
jgi:hypothetical protein